MLLLDYFSEPSPVIYLFLSLSTIWIIKYLYQSVKRLYSLPPGPFGIPIFGYYPFLKHHSYIQFDQLSKKYGPVFSLKLGQFDTFVVCDWDNLKDAFANDALLARPVKGFISGIENTLSVISMSGEAWREHRRLSLHVLRNVGLGKREMETLISEEIHQFLSSLETNVIDLPERLMPSVSNNISALLFGHIFDYNDPEKVTTDQIVARLCNIFQFTGLTSYLPWLTKPLIFLGKANLKIIQKAQMHLNEFISKEVLKHKNKVDSTEVEDYIDGYLNVQSKRKDEIFNDNVLRRNVITFFVAGSETVTSTLTWTIMYLVQYPQYQEKIRSEIKEAIGTEKRPDFSDRQKMPFTLAFLYEVQRIESIVATNLIRRASQDTKIGSFNVPKDSLVLFNFWSVHHDPKLWPNPDKFDPNRFLADNGTKVIKPPYLVPFSAGKRACPGEGLANVELFLYTVGILQRFKIKSGKPLSFEAINGLTRRPKYKPDLIFEKISF
ncbi:cytochrome P450 2J6-like [Tetranychus urticae]|uniref:Cytochrome P450 n=1 Tax=Tetranychus urticae TaxID=32264 RepID=T1K9W5_TETUR|nr:cytochrome P450 2J6-like [Tetranychus urticae]